MHIDIHGLILSTHSGKNLRMSLYLEESATLDKNVSETCMVTCDERNQVFPKLYTYIDFVRKA